MSDDLIEIEVDGKSVQAKKGQMIIEATDKTSVIQWLHANGSVGRVKKQSVFATYSQEKKGFFDTRKRLWFLWQEGLTNITII